MPTGKTQGWKALQNYSPNYVFLIEPPDADPHVRWCERERLTAAPYSICDHQLLSTLPRGRGSCTSQKSNTAVTSPPIAETIKVVWKPAVSAIQPPISGAMMVKGATNVLDK